MGQSQSQPQSQTKPLMSNQLNPSYNSGDTPEQSTMYFCRLVTSKHNTSTVLLNSSSMHSAHGTRFVYFCTSQPIVLTDYTTIICGPSETASDAVADNKTFHVSDLKYDTKMVYKGVHYNQFATPPLNDTKPSCRLLARLKDDTTQRGHTDTHFSYGENTCIDNTDRVLTLKDAKKVWEFVLEIHFAN